MPDSARGRRRERFIACPKTFAAASWELWQPASPRDDRRMQALIEDFHRNALMPLHTSRTENRAEGFGYASMVANHWPTSSGWTRSSSIVTACPWTARTCTPSDGPQASLRLPLAAPPGDRTANARIPLPVRTMQPRRLTVKAGSTRPNETRMVPLGINLFYSFIFAGRPLGGWLRGYMRLNDLPKELRARAHGDAAMLACADDTASQV